MKRQKNKRKGFTLVELIVVIAILAVLSATAVVAYGNISAQARAAADNADIQAVTRALNTYNALAKTPIDTTNIGSLTPSGLKLEVSKGDIIDMDLGLVMETARWTEIKGKITYSGGAWIKATTP